MHLLALIPHPFRTMLVAVLATALLAVMLVAALAQTVAPVISPTSIDLSPLIETGFWIVNAVLVPLALWLGALITRKLKLDRIMADTAMNKMLHDGIQRGIDALEGEARERLYRDGRPITVDVGNPLVATVANRLIRLSPELLKRMGIDELTLKELVAEKLTPRFANSAGLVETSALAPTSRSSVDTGKSS